MAMVVQANRESRRQLGGHIASFQSAATLYDVGFNHFFKGPDHPVGADLLYIQGHCSPGIYARAFLEGRLDEERARRTSARRSTAEGPLVLPAPVADARFWQFPTVSMGLGPIMAIYQARFMKYLDIAGWPRRRGRKVWAFMGDGEMDEPESLGAIGLAAREELDNLDLRRQLQPAAPRRPRARQRQDHPGAGGHVPRRRLERDQGDLGRPLGSLLAKDKKGLLLERMEEAVDGDYQATRCAAAPTRESTSSARIPSCARWSPT